ncbi:uncharacterized protein LOC141608261 [Silene latifolia]|uniref:uncharacterized protein LOC141608261 n=1 Tax=Silene latifolia TaxID=37657 RepID=UPI003D779180
MVPRHGFFMWLAVQHRLLTQDRMVRMGILQNNCCWLCGNEKESHDQLFFSCSYSRQCLSLFEDWMQIPIPAQGVTYWWLHYRVRSLLARQVLAASLAYLMYELWHARNRCRVDSVMLLPTVLFRQV